MSRLPNRFFVGLALMFTAMTVNAATVEEGLKAAQAGDYARARAIWEPLAQKGDAAAQYNMGVMYANGHGVQRDPVAAFGWYRRAALQGYERGRMLVGSKYLDGAGTGKDVNRALRIFLSLGKELESESAQYIKKILTGLYPAPLKGWEAGEVTWRYEKMIDIFFAASYNLEAKREYRRKGSDEKVIISVQSNNLIYKVLFDAFYGPPPKTEKEVAAHRERREQAEKLGFRKFAHGFINGLAAADSAILILALDEDVYVSVETSKPSAADAPPELVRAHVSRMDLRGIRSVLQNTGIRTMEDGLIE